MCSKFLVNLLVSREIRLNGLDKKDVVAAIVQATKPVKKISESTIYRYWKDGLSVARLAGSGLFFILPFMLISWTDVSHRIIIHCSNDGGCTPSP